MTFQYRNQGVCSRGVTFEIDNGILHNVRFDGGCNGNTQGISALVEGMSAQDAVARLCGIKCGFKDTSCPDQLAKAVKDAMDKVDLAE